ncbi:DMT family transporter [Roseospira marina]|uniref:DMT family transporter n=1 Tax=Roseospira marina TaxID=140057 RepID=A0A5M6I948_9PROT|nr:DMT family transporter [Roseospira marina]KAA5604198.1 DMT family transporter [Roseospira marina]MBB4315705.1 drug/metabolite transporter (DMT)-like permease [Roseospira marina]MBB5088817.1 drug/metabolite transporter (DMT)-like permease [Roseospira marina]
MEWVHTRSEASGRYTRGLVWITIAVFLLSLSDALVKAVGDSLGLAQIVVLRSTIAALLIAGGLCLRSGRRVLRPRRPVWVWLRSACLTAMWLCYYAGLPMLSLPLAAACYYTSPVWMALLSRCVLKEAVGWRGGLAIALTLAGVVLAIDPRPATATPAVALPLAAAFFYALAGIITRSRCADEHPGAMALTLNVALIGAGALGLAGLALFAPAQATSFALAVWPPMAAAHWALIAVLGVFLAIITLAVAEAYRLAPTPVVGVFDTAYLLFAAVWSVLLFGALPSPQDALGLGLIAAGAGLLTLGRR